MEKYACVCGSVSFDYCMTTNANLAVDYRFVCHKCGRQYEIGFDGHLGKLIDIETGPTNDK